MTDNASQRGNRWMIGAGIAVALTALAAGLFQMKYSEPPLGKYRALPEFELTERGGGRIHLADLKGKVWLADFIYTTCPGTCPMLSSRLSALQNTAFKDSRVRFVSISVNPVHDTPEVLRQYAEKFRAVPGKWLFLTGTPDAVRALVNGGFLLSAGEPSPDKQSGELVHSTKIALVDQNGVVRAYYDGTDGDDAKKIERGICRLLRE